MIKKFVLISNEGPNEFLDLNYTIGVSHTELP